MKLTVNNLIILACLTFASLLSVQTYFLFKKDKELKNTKNELVDINTLLKNTRDSVSLLDFQNDKFKAKIDSLHNIVLSLEKDKNKLYEQLDSALSAIDSIPPDLNYKFLQDSAYNYPGDKVYPFNGKQVTEIRKSFVENQTLKKIVVNMETTLSALRKQNKTQDSVIINKELIIKIQNNTIDELHKVVIDQNSKVSDLERNVNKQKAIKHIFQGTTVAGIIFGLISIL